MRPLKSRHRPAENGWHESSTTVTEYALSLDLGESSVTRDETETYIIEGGQAGRDRLNLLHQVFRVGTQHLLDEIEIAPGMKCLDVGCGGGDVAKLLATKVGSDGQVVGTDADISMIELASAEAQRQGLKNIQYLQGDAYSTFCEHSFDLVYSRLLLTHLSAPEKALAAMCGSVKRGGWVVIEDMDATRIFSDPEIPAISRYLELYIGLSTSNGGDPAIGPKLPGLLRRAGVMDVEVRLVQQAGYSGPVKQNVVITAERTAQRLVQNGYIGADEMTNLLRDNHRAAVDPDILISAPLIVQAWGRIDTD